MRAGKEGVSVVRCVMEDCGRGGLGQGAGARR